MNSRIVRNKRIVEGLKAGKTVAELQEEVGLTAHQIRNIAQFEGVEIKVKGRRGRKRTEDLPTLSSLHRSIGFRQSVYRVVENDLDINQFATETRIPAARVTLAEAGKHDYTLSQLQNLANVMKVPLVELLTDMQENIYEKEGEWAR